MIVGKCNTKTEFVIHPPFFTDCDVESETSIDVENVVVVTVKGDAEVRGAYRCADVSVCLARELLGCNCSVAKRL